MPRRILTAYERVAAWYEAAVEPPDPTEYGYPKAHWSYEHSQWEPARSGWEGAGTHTWNIVPPSYPAMTTLEDDFGRSHTVYYDPERTQVTRGEFRPELSTRPNRIEDLSPPSGLLWRGMSDEEYQEARERGYFESRGEHNIGDEQRGRTYFSTDPGQAAHYADGFAPWQWQPTFDRPAHVVGIPNLPEYPQERITGGEGETERGLLGRIPFSQMSHHYTGNPFAILPGDFDINNDNWENTWQQGGRKSPVVYTTWEADPDFSPRTASRTASLRESEPVTDATMSDDAMLQFLENMEGTPNDRGRAELARLRGQQKAASYYDPMGEQDWNEIYGDLPDHVHRGIGVNLPDDLHRMVHDPAIPAEQRAQALLQHLTSPEARVSPWGNDWREGLGTSWSGDDSVAEDFARQSASQLTDYNQSQAGPNQDFTWGTDEDGDPVGKPGTAVMLRALRPELDEIDDDPNGDGSGMRYTYHGHGEQEVPVRGGTSMNIRGISWRPILPMFHPDYLTDPEEYTTHDFADDNWRTASRHRTAALAEDFVNKLRDEFAEWNGGGHYNLRYWPVIEDFLRDNYPAVSRDIGFGLEEARPLLRGEEFFYDGDNDYSDLKPYETGPEVENQLGYDPRNVAAGMVYLHNNANNINYPGSRDEELMEDEDLLYNIFSQRQKMQDEYNKKKSQQPEQLTLFSHRAAPVEGPR